jgi:membrane associated rhomboid family serine protease
VLRPLREDVPSGSLPGVVAALALLDVVLFGHVTRLAPSESIAFVERWGLVPRELLRAFAHPASAGLRPWLTPLTSMFLHGDALHLAGNLLYLGVFGVQIERLLGHARFLVFYAACGLAAAALHVALAPSSYVVTLGASGAISGLLGAYLVRHPGARLRLFGTDLWVPLGVFLALWIALQLASGLVALRDGGGGVAWWAHAGGFGAGAALAQRLAPARARLRS